MPKLIELIPSTDQLLALSSPQIAHAMLRVMFPAAPDQIYQRLISTHAQRINLHPQDISFEEFAPRQREAELRILEAWSWMESEQILIRTDSQAHFGFATLSLKGVQFFKNADFRRLTASRRITKDDLHEALHTEALSLFWQASYDTCVFAALKAVEVYVRAAGGFASTDIGVDLIRKAFGPNGPLLDTSAPSAEQQAVSNLFAGAIGLFKNPSSHRYVAYDAETCADVLVMSSRLLRMIDMRIGVP